ncbi:MAG: ATP-binding cassette domain-containing protein [Sulfuricellaceae bacterium]|nr:ATP-binding cassette domain-containing protein [Sulfuricellaceae bacterium]
MPLIQLDKISLAFGHVPLLDHAELVLEPGERVGLIGRNGTGKSSLLKVIAGTTPPDDGKVWRAPGMKMAYVEQEPELDPEHTVYEAVAEGLGDAHRLLVEYHQVAHDMGDPDADMDALLERMHDLQGELEAHDGWNKKARVESTLSKLALPEDVKVGALSGGQKKRVALARALVMQPELLLLDEPTNHLDLSAIEWLEGLLNEFSGSVMLITHDRRFLDNVATRIVELDRGLLTGFNGNFSAYQIKKQELLEIEAVHNAQFDKVLAQEEVWIRKGIKARCTRNEGRVLRLESLRRERAERRERSGTVNLNVDQGERSGKLVAELEEVSKAYGDKILIQNFTGRVMRGDKIGLVGPNGAGKSTLLKLILGELQPDTGSVKLGTKLAVAYFDQFRTQLDEEATLADTISKGSDFVEIGGEKKHVISYLEDFLFAPQRARSPVKSLSGGERNRLLLARLFTRPANILVLDEPTNDLDIETLELLESLLQEYSGTVLLVSHDRTFLDNVVTQVIAFEGDGKLQEYAGGYDDYVRSKAARDAVPEKKPELVRKSAPKSAPKVKLSFNETRELESLPGKIEALEKEQGEIGTKLAEAAIYRDDPQEAKRLQARVNVIEEALLGALARWEVLEEKQKATE